MQFIDKTLCLWVLIEFLQEKTENEQSPPGLEYSSIYGTQNSPSGMALKYLAIVLARFGSEGMDQQEIEQVVFIAAKVRHSLANRLGTW